MEAWRSGLALKSYRGMPSQGEFEPEKLRETALRAFTSHCSSSALRRRSAATVRCSTPPKMLT